VNIDFVPTEQKWQHRLLPKYPKEPVFGSTAEGETITSNYATQMGSATRSCED
jgi:hypothetical protein